jgi:hypothetical protein
MNLREEDIEYVYFSVPYAVIPNTYFNIDYQNQVLDVSCNGSLNSYTFPAGNCNAYSLATDFPSVLGDTTHWSITLNSDDGIYTIKNSVYPFQLMGSSTIDFVFGFSDTLTSVFDGSYNTVVCPRICNFYQLPRINMRCRDLASSCSVSNTGFCSSDVVVSIPNDSSVGGRIIYKNIGDYKHLLEVSSLQTFTIDFTDEEGDFINFNGISSYFALQFDIYRKPKEKPQSFREVLAKINALSANI